jgi:hypothetical protein
MESPRKTIVSPSFNCADALAPENKIAIVRITLVLNMS